MSDSHKINLLLNFPILSSYYTFLTVCRPYTFHIYLIYIYDGYGAKMLTQDKVNFDTETFHKMNDIIISKKFSFPLDMCIVYNNNNNNVQSIQGGNKSQGNSKSVQLMKCVPLLLNVLI